MKLKKELVDLCPKCGETHIAGHPGGRCYACGEKTKTVLRDNEDVIFTQVKIGPKQPLYEITQEFQPHFDQLAARVGLKKARWLQEVFLSDISDQKQPPPRGGVPPKAGEGRKEIVVFLPTFEQSEKASSSESEDCAGE